MQLWNWILQYFAAAKKKSSTVIAPQLGEDQGGDTGEKEKPSTPEDVLVITVVPPADCPGMIPEKKVGWGSEVFISVMQIELKKAWRGSKSEPASDLLL